MDNNETFANDPMWKWAPENPDAPRGRRVWTAYITNEPDADPQVRCIEEIDVWATRADQARERVLEVMASAYDPDMVIVHMEERFGLFF